jgi:hypothetical protein
VIFLCDTQKKCGMCPEANLANLDDNYCLYVYSLYISQVAEVAWRLFKFLLLLQFVNINWLPEKECSGNSLAGRNIRSLRRYLSNRLKPESPQASSVNTAEKRLRMHQIMKIWRGIWISISKTKTCLC